MGQLNGNGNTKEPNVMLNKYLNLNGLSSFWNGVKQYIANQIPTHLPNPENLTIQGNGTSLGTYNGLETKTINITPESIGASPSNHKHVNYLYKTIYLGGIEDTKGCLVKLNVEETRNAMISVKITGNSYGKLKPVFSIIEFYNYYNGGNSSQRIINIQGTHFGYDFGKINIFNYGGYIYLWFSQNGSFQSFNVFANWTNLNGVDNNVNVVDTITKAVMPTSGVSHLVEFELNKIPYGDFLPLIGGTMTGVINSQNIIPKTTNIYDLGNSSLKWANVYATRFIGTSASLTGPLIITGTDAITADLHFSRASYNYISGPSGSTIHMCPGGISKSSTTGYIFSSTAFYPGTTNAYSIGSSSNQWNNIYGKTLYENGTSLVDKYISKGTDATKVVLGDGSLKPISDFVTGTINETTISYADGILSMNFSDANVISYDNGALNLTL